VHAGTLDVRLHERWVELKRLVKVRQSGVAIASQVTESTAHVVRECLVLVQSTSLDSLLEGVSSLGVALTSTQLDSLETLAEKSLAAAFRQIGSLLKAFGKAVVAERLEVVWDECGRGKLLVLALHNSLGLGFGDLLQQTLNGLRRGVVAELVDDAACGVVEESFAVAGFLFICVGSAIQGLDVFGVDSDSGGGVVDNLRPVAHSVPAGGTVGVEDGIRFAEDGLAV
jgi:hypothetical protein